MKIYIAGPDVFRSNSPAFFDKVRDLVIQMGHIPLIPLDNDLGVDPHNTSKPELAELIFQGNIKMIQECDCVIANVVPFRGPSLDAGTAFEIGYAYATNRPVICYLPDDSDEDPIKFGQSFSDRSFSEDPYDTIEDFDQFDNLMISRSNHSKNEVVKGIVEAIRKAESILNGSKFKLAS